MKPLDASFFLTLCALATAFAAPLIMAQPAPDGPWEFDLCAAGGGFVAAWTAGRVPFLPELAKILAGRPEPGQRESREHQLRILRLNLLQRVAGAALPCWQYPAHHHHRRPLTLSRGPASLLRRPRLLISSRVW